MSVIIDFMTTKHRECDDFFSVAESAVNKQNWPLAEKNWQHFVDELLLHFDAEETILFVEFEQATGMTSGPTQVMRMEHEQMRALVNEITQALTGYDKSKFLELSDTLMVLMQQHNMKEEMMLYPMSAQHLTEATQVEKMLKAYCDKN
jgi:hemerythrin-like domain-containing protein